MPAHAEAFYILDFDRTLADTDKLLEMFIQVADEYIDISSQQLEKAAADVVRRGDSFDTAGYVRDYLVTRNRLNDWTKLEKTYVSEAKSIDMLLPGAAELIDVLQTRGRRYGMLTYGNPLWQQLKLAAAQLDHIPHSIMATKEKGRVVASWQQDNLFMLPLEIGGGTAERIILIDDKAVSFVDFPPQPCQGYWVLAEHNALPSQRGEVPANVTRLSNLNDIIDYLYIQLT